MAVLVKVSGVSELVVVRQRSEHTGEEEMPVSHELRAGNVGVVLLCFVEHNGRCTSSGGWARTQKH